MYGVTEGGNSVMVHIHNYLSYFYVEMSSELENKFNLKRDEAALKAAINRAMGQ
jgi:hypothetical protein